MMWRMTLCIFPKIVAWALLERMSEGMIQPLVVGSFGSMDPLVDGTWPSGIIQTGPFLT